MAENFPKLMKDTKPQIQEVQRVSTKSANRKSQQNQQQKNRYTYPMQTAEKSEKKRKS